MKKTILVTITKEIEVDLPDEMLTEDYLKEFSSFMFYTESQDDLFRYAAQYVARFNNSNVEGVGRVGCTELSEDVDTEILK